MSKDRHGQVAEDIVGDLWISQASPVSPTPAYIWVATETSR